MLIPHYCSDDFQTLFIYLQSEDLTYARSHHAIGAP